MQSNLLKYIKSLWALAMPMIIGNLAIILVGAGDVYVAAKHSTDTLAAISIANSIVSCVFLFGIGLLVGVSPLLSNFRGEKSNIKKYFLPTINFSFWVSVVLALVILLFVPVVPHLGFEYKLVSHIQNYMIISAFSVFGAFLNVGLREFLQSYEIVLLPNLINLAGVFLNVFLNFIFVFGMFGVPEMGVVGLAYASLLARTVLGLVMFLFCLKIAKFKRYNDFGYFYQLLIIGLPIAVAMLLEVIAFNLITIVVGRVESIYAAAQSILVVLSTATFMIPVAVSNALAVKVGYANGAKNYEDVKCYSASGVIMCVAFMAICGLMFVLFPTGIVRFFTEDSQLLNLCVPILFVLALFQVFDGLQVSIGGIFKGLKKTKIVMIGNLFAYWVFGLPLGFFLAFKMDMNLKGFWIGLAVSLFTLGVAFLIILVKNLLDMKRATHN